MGGGIKRENTGIIGTMKRGIEKGTEEMKRETGRGEDCTLRARILIEEVDL